MRKAMHTVGLEGLGENIESGSCDDVPLRTKDNWSGNVTVPCMLPFFVIEKKDPTGISCHQTPVCGLVIYSLIELPALQNYVNDSVT